MDDRLREHYGENAVDAGWRKNSYSLLENYVDRASAAAAAAATSVGTDVAVEKLRTRLEGMATGEFAFLLVHSGYIPDHYEADSSEETLHTKLTEVVVCEWGRRLGMDPILQKEKASTEDVTLRRDNRVIVCDTKSYRLGRSQAAPNVKDAIKQGDYGKWLSAYSKVSRAGGLVTFPSKHDWKKASDVYAYASNPAGPILLLFYEHLSYMVLHAVDVIRSGGLFGLLADYAAIFPDGPSKYRHAYWSVVENRISELAGCNDLRDYMTLTAFVVREAVEWAAKRIETRVEGVCLAAKEEVGSLPEEVLRELLVDSMTRARTKNLARYLENIRRFRL